MILSGTSPLILALATISSAHFFDFLLTSLIIQKTSADDQFFAEGVTLDSAFGYGDRLGTSVFATKNGDDCWRHTLRHGVLANGSCCCCYFFHK